MSSVTRTVRFQKEESDLIDDFLKRNPILDFSTLARLSITRFVKNPELQLQAVSPKPQKKTESRQEQ
jgi:hypothetical protein